MRRNLVRNISIILGIALVLALPQPSFSQYDSGYGGNSYPQNQAGLPGVGDQNMADAQNESDTTKKKKERKPLESYFFDDSMRKRSNFAWNASLKENKIKEVVIDTLQDYFGVDYEFMKTNVGSAYLGNLGGATIPLNYFTRPDRQDFSFTNAYADYLFDPENIRHFNVKSPFTQFNYEWAGKVSNQEENFRITHAQNAAPSTGFNVDFRNQGTRGIYSWQGAKARNLSAAFTHTGKKYSVHAGYVRNVMEIKENGGLAEDWHLLDSIYETPNAMPIKLSDARNKIINNTFYIVQTYGIPLKKLTAEDFSIAKHPSIFIGHSFEFSRFTKRYSDTRAKTEYDVWTKKFDTQGEREYKPEYYFDNWYIHPSVTSDSIAETRVSNKVFVQLQPWDRDGIIGVINAGVGYDARKYYMFKLDDYLAGSKDNTNNSSYIYGSAEGKFKEFFRWEADTRIVPLGYRKGDLEIGGKLQLGAKIKGHPVWLTGEIRNVLRTPSYWEQAYSSNHYKWSNSFDKENETRINASLHVPTWRLELGASQGMVNKKVYYDSNRTPAQDQGTVSISGLYAQKDFVFGGLHLNNRVLLQWSSAQEIIPVPLASTFLYWFYRFNVVKDVLSVDLGLDTRYNTEYYAFGYDPAIAQFYNQREKQLGNYVMMDAFLAAKWKRMRIIVKFQHVNENLFGENNYFQVLHYPLNRRILKIGMSWAFYD